MKPTPIIHTLGKTLLAGLMLAGSPLSAATYYWNENSPEWVNNWAGLSGSDTPLWGGASQRWATTLGGARTNAWPGTGSNDAVFTKPNAKIGIHYGTAVGVANVTVTESTGTVTFTGAPNTLNNSRNLEVSGQFTGNFRLDNSNTPNSYSLTVALNNSDVAQSFAGTATFARDAGGLAATVGDAIIRLNHVNATGLASRVAIDAKGTLRLAGTPAGSAVHLLGGLSGSSLEGRIDDGVDAYSGSKVLRVEQAGASSLAASIVENNAGSGTLGLTKAGSGVLTLTGLNHTYTGDTVVEAGALVVDGALSAESQVKVADGARLGGSGAVGVVSGTGEIAQSGNGRILTASSLDGGEGVGVAFRVHGLAMNYADAANSGNDLLRLDGETPFALALSGDNRVSVDFSALSGTLAAGQVYSGGFYVDGGDFLESIQSANFVFLGLDAGLTARVDTLAQSADFGAGMVDGWVTTFSVHAAVPEPSTFALLGAGLVGAWVLRRRRM